MDLRTGDRIDRYELVCRIAHGGMGEVWLARVRRMVEFERFFALKTVLPQHASDAKFRTMFLDEARIASAVVHPNVANIVDVGEHEGSPFLVMEWIDGDSLQTLHRTLMRQRQVVPLGILLRVVADACAGLHAVHEVSNRAGRFLDVVHRDVSPHNLLLGPHGEPKLIDFGVAKARERTAGDTVESGVLKGKVRYMAPEQARGEPVDRRADVWAMGAVLYTLIRGAPPYDGDNELAVLRHHLDGFPPPRLDGNVPGVVADVIARCLAVRPADRFATATELRAALEAAMHAVHLTATNADVAFFVGAKLHDERVARVSRIAAALSELESAPNATSDRYRAIMDLAPPRSAGVGAPESEGAEAIPATTSQPRRVREARAGSWSALVGSAVAVSVVVALMPSRSSVSPSSAGGAPAAAPLPPLVAPAGRPAPPDAAGPDARASEPAMVADVPAVRLGVTQPVTSKGSAAATPLRKTVPKASTFFIPNTDDRK